MRKRTRGSLWRWALGGLLLAGCGGAKELPVFPVRGKVLDAAGRPAVGAIVVFHPLEISDPDRPKPAGRVAADGAFQLGTYRGADGAPAGEYAVTVIWPVPVPAEAPEERDGRDRFQGRFNRTDRPKWRVHVREQPNELGPFYLK